METEGESARDKGRDGALSKGFTAKGGGDDSDALTPSRSGAGAGRRRRRRLRRRDVVGRLKDVGKAGARDRAAGVGVALLLGHGAVRVRKKNAS